MAISQDSVDAILVSLLAVQNYPLDRAWSLLPGLEKAELTNPFRVAQADVGNLVAKLTGAGYERGYLNGIMAPRVQNLMKAVVAGELDAFDALSKAGHRQAALELLCKVKGIGPKVANNAWLLLH